MNTSVTVDPYRSLSFSMYGGWYLSEMGAWCHSQRSPYLKDQDIIDCIAVLDRSHK